MRVLALVLVAVAVAGCGGPSTYERLRDSTPPCPQAGTEQWVLSHLKEGQIEDAKAALSVQGYTNLTVYGEKGFLEPPGPPYSKWSVMGRCNLGRDA